MTRSPRYRGGTARDRRPDSTLRYIRTAAHRREADEQAPRGGERNSEGVAGANVFRRFGEPEPRAEVVPIDDGAPAAWAQEAERDVQVAGAAVGHGADPPL